MHQLYSGKLVRFLAEPCYRLLRFIRTAGIRIENHQSDPFRSLIPIHDRFFQEC